MRMKKFDVFFVFAIACSLVAWMVVPAPAQKEVAPKTAKFDDVVCDSLTIKSKDGKHSLTMRSLDNGVGVWLNKGKDNVAMVSMGDQPPWFGLISTDDQGGCPIAFTRAKNGEAYMQIGDKDQCRILSTEELLKLLKPKK